MTTWNSSNYVPINVGQAPNDGTGTDIRDAFITVDSNFQNISVQLNSPYQDWLNANVAGTTNLNIANIASLTATQTVINTADIVGNIYANNVIANTGLYSSGITTLTGNTTVGNILITGTPVFAGANVKISTHITPTSNVSYDLGSPTNFFRNIYALGTVTVNQSQLTVGATLQEIPTQANVGSISDVGTLTQSNVSGTATTYAFFGWQNASKNFVYYQTAANPLSGNSVLYGGVYGNVHFGSQLLSNTTVSTSTSTGALIVSGGAGIGGAVYVGGNVTTPFLIGNTVSTTSTVGNIAVTGYVVGNLNIAGTNATINGYQVITTNTPGINVYSGLNAINAPVTITAINPSTSTSTGAFVLSYGGAGIAGNINVGGLGNFAGNVTAPFFFGQLTGIQNTMQAATIGGNIVLQNGQINAGIGSFTSIGTASLTATGSLNLGGATISGALSYTSSGTMTVGAASAASLTVSGASSVNTLTASGATTLNSTVSITGATTHTSTVAVNNTTNSTSTTTGAVTTTGGLGVALDSTFGGNVTLTNTGYLKLPVGSSAQRPGSVTLGMVRYNTSTNGFEGLGYGNQWTTLGGVRSVDGYAYISAEATTGAGDDILRFYSGSTGSSVEVASMSAGNVTVFPTTASTSTTTGALQVAGGAGIAGAINVGGTATITGATQVNSTFGATGAVTLSSTVGITGAATLSSTLAVTGTTTHTGAVTINSSTASTNSSTGALIVAGGIGVGGSVYSGGTFYGSGAGLTAGSIQNSSLANSTLTVNGSTLTLGGSFTITAAAGTLTGGTLNASVTASSLTSVGTLTGLSVSGTSTLPNIILGSSSNSGGGSWYIGSTSWAGAGAADSSVNSVTGISYSGGSGSQLFTLSSGPGQMSLQLDGSIFVGDTISYNPIGATGAYDGYLIVANGGSFGGSVYTNGQFNGSGAGLTGSAPSLSIGGVAPAGTLSGTTLSASVVASSLQSVGTIGTGVWQGSVINSTYGGTGVNNGGNTLTLAGSYTLNQSVVSGASPTFTATNFSGTANSLTVNNATNWGSYGAAPSAGTSFGTANTIGRSDGNGYTYFGYINTSSPNNESLTISQVYVTNGSDNFLRKTSIGTLSSQLTGTASSLTAGAANYVAWGNVGSKPALAYSDGGTYSLNISGTSTYTNYVNNDATSMRFHWSGQGGQPAWLWGANGAGDTYVYNPYNFSVNYATSAGSAGSVAWGNISGIPAIAYNNGGTYGINVTGYSSYLQGSPAYTNGSDGWFRSNGAAGWYSASYGGGIYCQDATWVRVYNNFGFYVSNQIVATGAVTAYYSDERLKTKIGNIESPLDKVRSLNGFYYVENELAKSFGYNNDKKQIALSAQEVQAVVPEAVSLAPFDMETNETTGEITSKSGDDYLTVDYARLVPLLVEAIKELEAKVEELNTRLGTK